jgi:hypothetical protein
VIAAEAGGKPGRHADLVAGACGCVDVEDTVGLAGDGDLRHAVTIASWQVTRSLPPVSWHGCRLRSRLGACPEPCKLRMLNSDAVRYLEGR